MILTAVKLPTAFPVKKVKFPASVKALAKFKVSVPFFESVPLVVIRSY